VRVIRLVGWAVTLLAICGAAAMLVPSALGYDRYVLVGGSMEPTIHLGSLVYDETVPTRSLRVGDVITVLPPGQARQVTHRIHSISNVNHERVFRTKGDHNKFIDPWKFTLRQKTQARFKMAIPYAGWPFIFLADRTHRFIALGVPVLIIALFNLVGVMKDARKVTRGYTHA
jgi:signal peptidase